MTPLSVNEVISRLDEFDGLPVIAFGMLVFDELKDISLHHTPRSEAQDNPGRSFILLDIAGRNLMNFDARVCERWRGKIVTVEGIIHKVHPELGEEHMGLWRPILFAQDMYRSRSLRIYSS